MPLPLLLKLAAAFCGTEQEQERAALLRCLREIWWVSPGAAAPDAEQEPSWIMAADSWWAMWWGVLRGLRARAAEFLGLSAWDRAGPLDAHFLDDVVPCLVAFLKCCCETKLGDLLDGEYVVDPRDLVGDLITVANGSPGPTRERFDRMDVLWCAIDPPPPPSPLVGPRGD